MECLIGPLMIILPLILIYYLANLNSQKVTARIERLEAEVTLLRTMLQEQRAGSLDRSAASENLAAEISLVDEQVTGEVLTEESTMQIPSPSMDLQPFATVAETTVPEMTASETIEPEITIVSEMATALDESSAAHREDEAENAEAAWSMPLLGWFMRSNILVQIGIVILFFGVGFLLKYVADLGFLTLRMRHVAAVAGGVALTGLGWFLRSKMRFYGLALQGAGLGVIYLTTFFAFRIYELIPASVAFPILVALGILCAAMAVLNDARVLAFLAIIGAFLAPILASNNTGSHVMLFSYYALVNSGVLAIAWFKAWRSLNLASFFFTLAAGLFWGIDRYSPALFNSTEPFVILFFAFFLLIAILYGWRKAEDVDATHTDLIDTIIVFGNPFSIFAIQSVLMRNIENGLGLTAAAMGLVYGIVGALFLLRDRRWTRSELDNIELNNINRRHPLTEAFLFLCFFFLAWSVPLLFEPKVTTAIWAVYGAVLVWLGTRRQRSWNRIFGLLVQVGAGAFFVSDYVGEYVVENIATITPFANPYYIGSLLLAGAGLFSAYHLWRGKQGALYADESVVSTSDRWPAASALVMVWGLGWWFGGGIMQIVNLYVPNSFADTLELFFSSSAWETVPANLWTTLLLFVAGSAALFELVGRMLGWQTLRRPMLLLLPALGLFSLIQLVYVPHHFAGTGWLIWPAVLALFYWILCQQQGDFSHPENSGPLHTCSEKFRTTPPKAEMGQTFSGDLSGFGLAHAGAFWLIAFLLSWFAGWYATEQSTNNVWMVSAVIAVPSLLILLTSLFIETMPQPFRSQRNAYLGAGIAPVAIFGLMWSLLIFGSHSGDVSPMRYIPLLNPLDLAHVGLFSALLVWLRKHEPSIRWTLGCVWGVLGFVAFNLLIARTVHHIGSVAFTWDALFYFAPLQMIYSVLWGALALVLMFWSRRNGERILWGSGAIILALTIAKLFLVDLANSDSIARIVSFIGVGILVMIIAYFAPAPERQEVDDVVTLVDLPAD